MVATRTAGASARSGASPRPATRRPQGSPLEVVRADGATRSVGALGTAIAIFMFVTLLAMAGLHAALVQAQSGLDDLVEENGVRRERVDQLLAQVAHLDSPEGVAEAAAAAGLVAAPEVVTIAPLPPGGLAAPSADPFAPAGVTAATEVAAG